MPTRIEALWTAKDVAIYLQVSLSWVRHATAAGQVPHHRIGHNVRSSRRRSGPGSSASVPRSPGSSRPGLGHFRSARSAERKAGVTPFWGADASLPEKAASPVAARYPFTGGSLHG